MAIRLSDEEFDGCVDAALDGIPDELFAAMENCVVVVEPEGPDDEPDLLGYYDGVPLTERGYDYGGVLPDRIVICKGPLERMCATREELVVEITITVRHEIAHHFGIDDHRLDELGYA